MTAGIVGLCQSQTPVVSNNLPTFVILGLRSEAQECRGSCVLVVVYIWRGKETEGILVVRKEESVAWLGSLPTLTST